MDIALALRSQLFATLMAAVESSPLAPGSIVSGRVSALPKNAPATLLVNGQPLSVIFAGPKGTEAAVGLQIGSLLRLRVESVGADGSLRAAILPAADSALRPMAEAGADNNARATLGQAVAGAVGRQLGLAPLFANLEALVSPEGRATLPPEVVRAAAAALGLRYDPASGDGARLRAAVEHSGVFHESLIAAGDADHLDIAGTDLKSALMALRAALKADAAGQSGAASSSLQAGAPATPAPPHREAMPQAQGAAEASVDPVSGAPRDTLGMLARQTEGGLERLRLLQVASLPAEQPAASQAAQPQRWLIEVPMALDGRTHVLPLRIEREREQERRNATTEREGPLWRVRFALDGEPLGPLQAIVTWRLRQVGVTLWVERDATREALRSGASQLRQALNDRVQGAAGLDQIEIDIRSGVPADPRPAPGLLLDRRS